MLSVQGLCYPTNGYALAKFYTCDSIARCKLFPYLAQLFVYARFLLFLTLTTPDVRDEDLHRGITTTLYRKKTSNNIPQENINHTAHL